MTEEEYQIALNRVWLLMGALPDTPEEAELITLSKEIDEYEDIHFPIDFNDFEPMEE
jgi:hypothetical protein